MFIRFRCQQWYKDVRYRHRCVRSESVWCIHALDFLRPVLFGNEQQRNYENIKDFERCWIETNFVYHCRRRIFKPSFGQTVRISEKAWFEENVKSLLDCVKKTSDAAISQGPKIMQMKLTALMKSSLCEKITQHLNKGNEDDLTEMFDACLANKFEESPLFTADENQQVHGAMLQLLKVFSYAEKKDVYIMLDAEYTDINPTIVLVAKSLMKRFNKTKPTVQTTYQAYLKSALDDVKKDLDFCLRSNLHFGAKIVRGAYMNAERHKAAAKNREDPICEDWNSTNDNYNRVVSHILQRVSSQTKPAINVTVATHNEESVTLAIDRMIWNKIDSSSGQVTFAQIYGLSDHLSNSLAVNGFLVYKSVPIGGMEETLPYLSRRVHENNGLMKKTRKDRDLIWKELRKRFVLF